MDDIEKIIERAKESDEGFRGLYEKTIDHVYAFVLLRTRDKSETSEICQEVYVSLWKSLQRFEYNSPGQFWAFLWKVVRRQIIKWHDRLPDMASLEEIYDIPEEPEIKEDYKFLLSVLTTLPERQRLVVEQRYFSDLSFAEIGDRLGISETNAKVLNHRAIETLRKKMKTYE